MKAYAVIVMLFRFFVVLMLLLGADRLYRQETLWWRVFFGAGIGGLHAGLCLIPGFLFLSSMLWQVIFLAVIGIVAYGCHVRLCITFVLLNLALDGIGAGLGRESLIYLAMGAPLVAFLCLLGFENGAGKLYVPVELSYKGRQVQLTALRDTGNTLQDPVTGRSVLIIGADAARRLTGLTHEQIRRPLESLSTAGVPGLRIVPYHTVGQKSGFLLALQVQDTRIGRRRGSCLVAFAPEGLGETDTYQALTGGAA